MQHREIFISSVSPPLPSSYIYEADLPDITVALEEGINANAIETDEATDDDTSDAGDESEDSWNGDSNTVPIPGTPVYSPPGTQLYSPPPSQTSPTAEPDLPVYIGHFVSTIGDIHFSKIMFNNRILSSDDMLIIDDILDGEYGYHWKSSCEYSFWVIKEANFAPDKFAPLTRGDPFVAKILDSTLLDNATHHLGMSYEDFKELIDTDVIALPMLEDEESVATALMIIGTSSAEELQSGVSTDEGSVHVSLGDG